MCIVATMDRWRNKEVKPRVDVRKNMSDYVSEDLEMSGEVAALVIFFRN